MKPDTPIELDRLGHGIRVIGIDLSGPPNSEDTALAGEVASNHYFPQLREWLTSLGVEGIQQTRTIRVTAASAFLSENMIRFSTGIRYTLGLTIYYEVGTIERFATPRHFPSYCRLIPGTAESDKKARRGRGSKQGNHYLKWAFTQAANIAVRYYPTCRKFRDKQANRRVGAATTMVANCILAHKLARATYHVIREETPFHMDKLF